jgi:CRISPR system Cascade subunit CasB
LAIKRNRREEQSSDSKLTPTERRFLHLLAAERGDELYKRVTRMVLMAKSVDVPINYKQLEKDLNFWKGPNDHVRTAWAASFWTPGVDAALPSTAEEGAEP